MASPISVKLPEGMRERLDTAAASAGMSRNALIVKSLERTLGIKQVDDELPAEAHPCPHPKEKLRRFAYGTFCGECRARIR